MWVAHVWQLLNLESHVRKVFYFYLVYKKLFLLTSLFSQPWYMRGIKEVEKKNLWTFNGTATVFRRFFFLVNFPPYKHHMASHKFYQFQNIEKFSKSFRGVVIKRLSGSLYKISEKHTQRNSYFSGVSGPLPNTL